MSTARCPNTWLGCSMQVCKPRSHFDLWFLSWSCYSWTLDGSHVQTQPVYLYCMQTQSTDLFNYCLFQMRYWAFSFVCIHKVSWVLSSPLLLCWEDLWWWGPPGTQQALWEVCLLWPCVLQVRSSWIWVARWLWALEWSSLPPSVSIIQFHLRKPVFAALQKNT